MDTIGHGQRQVTPAPRQPRALRFGVLAFELGLVVLIAFQASDLLFRMLEPANQVLPASAAQPQAGSRLAQADMRTLTSTDPFFRQIGDTGAVVLAQAAPESSLRLELFGLRATGDGQGSAIIKTQDGAQQLVRVGDVISPGVKLAGVYKDRVEIVRAGSLEAVYLRPQGERAAKATAPRRNSAAQGTQGSPNALTFLSTLNLEAVRRERRIIGFRLPDSLPDMASALGLEEGDILLAANGQPLNSFERIAEIGEELAGSRRVELTIERRGETRSLSLGL